MSAPVLAPERPATVRPAAAPPLRASRGWAVPWRLAMRDARRHRGRTAVIAVMVGLPVLLTCAVATLYATRDVSVREGIPAWFGTADAVVRVAAAAPAPPGDAEPEPPDVPTVVAEAVERTGASVALARVYAYGTVSAGRSTAADVTVVLTEPSNPLAEGMDQVLSGRLPLNPGEAAASPGLLDALDAEVGDSVEVAGTMLEVTGTAVETWASRRDPWLLVPPGGPLDDAPGLDRSGEVTVLLAGVAERPGAGAGTEEFWVEHRSAWDTVGGGLPEVDGGTAVTAAAALTLVVIQLTLLAGPAFAVGVRQQRRTLSLLVAAGADGRALRRVVLAGAGVVSVTAAVVGAVVGTAAALAAVSAVRDVWPGPIGPLDVRWDWVVGAVVVGVVSAVLAALFPALSASRATVRAAVRGATGRPRARYPWRLAVAGVLVFAASTALLGAATTGVTRGFVQGRIEAVAVGLVTLTVGMLMVVPLAVALLLPLGRVLPLPLRLATRDAARAAGRSVAAVAAVAAATGGLVALATAMGSQDAYERAAYLPYYPSGAAVLLAESPDPAAMSDLDEALESVAPGAAATRVGALTAERVRLDLPGCDLPEACLLDEVAVASEPVVAALPEGGPSATETAHLDGAVVLWAGALGVDAVSGPARLVVTSDDGTEHDVEVDVVVSPGQPALASALVSPATADALFGWREDRLVVAPGSLSGDQIERLVGVVDGSGGGYVLADTGYEPRAQLEVIGLALAALAAVVGGTLAATALTLADARRDRALVAAAGGGPRTGRLVAGSTALVVAALGGIAGTLFGLVPGVIAAAELTDYSGGPSGTAPTVVVPWLVIAAVVVGLPLVLGGLVALVSRGPAAVEGARASSRPGPVV